MRTVHGILVVAVIFFGLAGCESKKVGFEDRPQIQGEEYHAVDDSERERPLPKGFVADAATNALHRADCPRVKEIDPSDRVFYVTPHPALNEGYEPCEYCRPLYGWK
jgi:hypothetical protein